MCATCTFYFIPLSIEVLGFDGLVEFMRRIFVHYSLKYFRHMMKDYMNYACKFEGMVMEKMNCVLCL